MEKNGRSLIHGFMRQLRKVMPGDSTGENPRAVRVFQKMLTFREVVSGNLLAKWLTPHPWPVTSGTYIVTDRKAPVAVCTLTSPELMVPLSKVEGVAITGRMVTVNLGIERIILNTITNPNLRYLVICGKESPVFYPAQALVCLFEKGVDPDRRIIDARGHYPVLRNVTGDQIETFRQQVKLIDCTEEQRMDILSEKIKTCSRAKEEIKGKKYEPAIRHIPPPGERFKKIRPGGRRDVPVYDPNGFFVILVDHEAGEIILRHYLSDNTPAHEMRGRGADGMIRALVQQGLVSQLSHAGYLGVELARAETALRLGLSYEQDHPLHRKPD